MISRCGLLKKKESMTTEAFRDFWFYDHGPIAAQMKNLRHYEQHLVLENAPADQLPRSGYEIDGYSELYFDDLPSMEDGVASLAGKGTNDLPNFTDDCRILIFDKKWEKCIPEKRTEHKFVKLICFVQKGEKYSAEDFHREWWEKTSECLSNDPAVVGFAKNLVIDRLYCGKHAAYDVIPFDGMAELWFEDSACLDSFLADTKQITPLIGAVNSYIIETARYL